MSALNLNWDAMNRLLSKLGAPKCAKEAMRQIVEGTYPKTKKRRLNGNATRALVDNGLIRHSPKKGVLEPTAKAMRLLRRRVQQVDQ
jgi:hypothetical protein